MGLGWGSDSVTLDLKYTMQFLDCYKTLLDDLGDWSKNWMSEEAKFVTECTTSSSTASDISLVSWDLVPSSVSQSVVGG